MTPTITAFKTSPDKGRGHARDFRVRWALEEVGQPYEVKLVTFEEMKRADYKKLQAFGQIPAYTEGDLTIFETGAIVFHVAETRAGLLPEEKNARARAVMWMFAALNTVEPPIVEREGALLLERDKPYHRERLPRLDERVHKRLRDLEAQLGDREWINGEFSAADILMVTVLRRPAAAALLDPYPKLKNYVARAEARPAYQRAFAAQRAVFEASAAPCGGIST